LVTLSQSFSIIDGAQNLKWNSQDIAVIALFYLFLDRKLAYDSRQEKYIRIPDLAWVVSLPL